MASWLFVTGNGDRHSTRHHILEIDPLPSPEFTAETWPLYWFCNVYNREKAISEDDVTHYSPIVAPVEMRACVTFVQPEEPASVLVEAV